MVTQCSYVRLCSKRTRKCARRKTFLRRICVYVCVPHSLRLCVQIGNDKTYKMYINVRSACYSTHKCIQQKLIVIELESSHARKDIHKKKYSFHRGEYTNVIVNHNRHNMRWADRQSEDIYI